MKKIVAILFVLALALPAMADTVSLTKATDAASAFFNAGSQTRAGRVTPQLVWMGAEVTRSPYSAPFYVFNNPQGGWIMIAGEDSGHAILGWSDEGRFDPSDLPANATAWFEEYANQITWARTHFLPQSESSAREWSDLLEGRLKRSSVVTLSTPNWNQDDPYNQFCPTKDGVRPATGCVATAIAELMYYHAVVLNLGMPVKGTGVIGGYTSSKELDDGAGGYTNIAPTENLDAADNYDWANMTLNKPSSTIQKTAVATLIYHVGLMSKMNYGSSSGAHTQNAVAAMITHMGYDPAAHIEYRSSYSQREWLAMIKNEIGTEQRPVLFSGYGSGGAGHEFLGVGYTDNDEITMNWGWGGSKNGNYAIDFFTPASGGIGGGSYDYRFKQHAVFNLKPLVGEPTNALRSLELYYKEGEWVGFTATENGDNQYLISLSNRNMSASPCTTDRYVVVCDYSETIRYDCSEAFTTSLPNLFSVAKKTNYPVSLVSKPAPRLGDRLMVKYMDTDGQYKLLKNKGGYAIGDENKFNNNYPIYDIPVIRVKDNGSYNVGDRFDLIIDNSRTAPANMEVHWFIDGNEISFKNTTSVLSADSRDWPTDESIVLTAGEHIVKAVVTIGGETQTLIQEIHVE